MHKHIEFADGRNLYISKIVVRFPDKDKYATFNRIHKSKADAIENDLRDN